MGKGFERERCYVMNMGVINKKIFWIVLFDTAGVQYARSVGTFYIYKNT